MSESPAALDFRPATRGEPQARRLRPSLSYWQDAWRRLKLNPRAIASLALVIALLLFTLVGPLLWTLDPASQDLDQVSAPPGAARTAEVVLPYSPWAADAGAGANGHTSADGQAGAATHTDTDKQAAGLRLAAEATTQSVRFVWDPIADVRAYEVFRDLYPPTETALGLPLGEVLAQDGLRFEDRLALEPIRYFYTVVPVAAGNLMRTDLRTTIEVPVKRVITREEAIDKGLVAADAALRVGDEVRLRLHPLGTDYLGRDMLARLMHGARVSLFIGIVAPVLYVLLGVAYGSLAGFVGGAMDQTLMRFADFVVALPFLLFMILFKVLFGIGPGESGIIPMLVALVILGWPATARLVRGQILQIREAGYVSAAKLMGSPTSYLIIRHMIPNTLGVILVTLTFAIPSAIFTEAFLSFIGMGVAPPTPSWGSMSNEGIKSMLDSPHELIFPAILISVTVLAFNLLGDGLRDALDARMRSSD